MERERETERQTDGIKLMPLSLSILSFSKPN